MVEVKYMVFYKYLGTDNVGFHIFDDELRAKQEMGSAVLSELMLFPKRHEVIGFGDDVSGGVVGLVGDKVKFVIVKYQATEEEMTKLLSKLLTRRDVDYAFVTISRRGGKK